MVHRRPSLRARVSPEEYQLLMRLRERQPARHPPETYLSIGERVADWVAATVGSWRFIITQSIILTLWVILNVIPGFFHWDPEPFILLNLMLSFQAAYTAPIIMMSQNRQSNIDRQNAEHDRQVNMKAELEIELLQDKMNVLREQEITEAIQMLRQQQESLRRLEEILLKSDSH